MAVTRLTCRSCEAKLKVSAEPGTAVKCPRCGKSTRVPEPEPEDDFEVVDEEEEEEPAPKKRSAAITPKNGKAPPAKSKPPRDEDEEEPEDDFEEVDDEPAPKKRRDGITSKAVNAKSSAVSAGKRSRAADEDEDEEEEEERPRKRGKKKEKAGSPALLWIGVGGGGLVLVVGVVVALLLFLPRAKDPGKAPPGPLGGPFQPPKPRGHQSPQEAWDAFIAAHKSKDSKKLVECLSPESRRAAAVELAYGGILFRSVAKNDPTGGLASQRKPTLDALDKHGLTADATKNVAPALNFDPNQPPNLKDALQRKNSLAGMIKDHEGLLADLLAAGYQEKFDPNSAVLDGATLKDVKIEGNTATGTIVKQVANVQKETPVQFTKTDDGWFIVPTMGKK
jgi:hypothetical protein